MRTFLACVLSVVVGLFAALEPSAAAAGQYTVIACEAAPGAVNHSWTQGATRGLTATTACPDDTSLHRAGIETYADLNVGTLSAFSSAYSRFDAPAGTTIGSATLDYELSRSGPHWFTGLEADDARLLEGCRANDGSPACDRRRIVKTYRPAAKSLRLSVACGDIAGCSTGSTSSWPYARAYSAIHSAQVVLDDPSSPALTWTDGGLTGAAWLHGRQTAPFSASDNSGIRETQLYVDGARTESTSRSCDYSYSMPCSDVSSDYPVDTRTLADGVHALSVEAYDAGGNTTRRTATVLVDNTPPDQVADLAVADGEANWRPTNSFSLSWRNPSRQASPIAVAHYELADSSGRIVASGSQTGTGITALSNLRVPGPGDYTARIWLGDEAGNANSANKSSAVHLRFDDVAPGAALPTNAARWLGAGDAGSFAEHIEPAPGAMTPASGIAGYSVTTDGTEPDGTIDVLGPSADYRFSEPPEGKTLVKARAVSGAGVPSSTVGTATILLDLTPPTMATVGAPDPDRWLPGPVSFKVIGVDQAQLADMTPAPDDQPVETGGYIALSVDNGDIQRIRGAVATPVVTSDGDHVVTYQAFDAAGNPSDQESVRVRVDGTAPDKVSFHRPDPTDPRMITASASDRTSGIEGGRIEVRAPGSSDWRPLSTTASWNGTLKAQLDDLAEPRGIYELRAVAWDRALNQTTGDRYADGSRATVDTRTLREEAQLHVDGPVIRRLRFGKASEVRGRLTTPTGSPIAAKLDVLVKLHASGATYRKVGELTTDSRGRFDYQAGPDGSRTIRFAYEGDARRRPTHGDLAVLVRASSTIKGSPHRLRVGETVTLTGRLETLGLPVPHPGKLIDLEAFDRGGWRKFATVRTTPEGTWSYTYRFVATHGTVTYPMRAVVVREAAYPFETGTSKTVRITVRGP